MLTTETEEDINEMETGKKEKKEISGLIWRMFCEDQKSSESDIENVKNGKILKVKVEPH